MTGNQFRFVALTVFTAANVVAAWRWSERLGRPHGELRTLGDFFAMPKVQRWSTIGLLVVVGFAASRLWTAPDAPRDILLITVPLPFLPPVLTWWIDHWRAIGRRDAAELAEARRLALERQQMRMIARTRQ